MVSYVESLPSFIYSRKQSILNQTKKEVYKAQLAFTILNTLDTVNQDQFEFREGGGGNGERYYLKKYDCTE